MKLLFLLFSLFFVINITEGSYNDSVIITINKDLLEKSGRTEIFQKDSYLDGDIPQENVQSLMKISTKTNDLNDTHEQLLVHWVGGDSNIIVCLAKDLHGDFIRSSAVYLSYDNGDTFVNKSEEFLINSTIGGFATVDKFYIHPKYKNYMIFTDTKNKKIYISKNYGHHLTRHSVEFHPSDLSFHENRPHVLIIHDKIDPMQKLWISVDYGRTWHLLHTNTKKYFWRFNQLTGNLILERKEPSGYSTIISVPDVNFGEAKTNVIIENVNDFQVFGNFMFASKQIAKNNFDLYVSYKDGPFVKAQFSSELPKQSFHIVDITNDRILLAVHHKESYSHLYVSDVTINGSPKFTLSLENVLAFFPKHSQLKNEAIADVYKVQGLDGIYIATQMTSSKSFANITSKDLVSRITFDHGNEWKPIQPPKFNNDGNSVNCTLAYGCSLHLSQRFNKLFPDTKYTSIISSKSAPGVIIATGVIGSNLEGHLDVYISHDAGISWKQGLKDNYFFNMGDYGGILTAIKYFKPRQILYSMNGGNTWTEHVFDNDELKIYGLMTEFGENTTAFTIIGSTVGHHNWRVRKIDLATILTFVRKCELEDYEMWSPSKTINEISHIPCILGKETTYQRRKSGVSCYNGRDFERQIKTSICECDAEDFECDSGFIRSNQTFNCIKNKTLNLDPYKIPASCKPGSFFNRTRGYRKINGDVCIDGYPNRYLPDLIPCPFDEVKNFLLLARRTEIVRINLHNNSQEILPIKGLQNTVDIEYDLKNNCVYWTDVTKKHIGRQCVSNKTEILLNTDLGSVEGLAFDWVSNILYFTDGVHAKIEAIRTDISHHMRKTIVDRNHLVKPRGIAVHPKAGYLFWTDWNWNPSIGRSNLDGTNIKTLFTKPTITWPNGITIDYIAERIYLVDGKMQYIASSDLNGQHFKKLLTNDDRILHLYSIAVHNGNIFWDNFGHPNIYIADKDFGDSIQKITFDRRDLAGLKVFGHGTHEGSNPCSNKTRCSHICFGAPKGQFVCSCPDNMEMLNGHCICKRNQHVCNNGNCILKELVCDGKNDCGDSSDEMGCGKSRCKDSQFQCDNKQCIPLVWRCDGSQDCKDGSDEAEENCKKTTCTKDQFKCNEERCIYLSWICDGVADCKDGSDEHEDVCKNKTCSVDQFQCTDKSCVSRTLKCDGKIDCSDGSDEVNCTKKQCKGSEFKCEDNLKCLPLIWRCDGDIDCRDGSDEREDICRKKTCSVDQFQCTNKYCIPKTWVCNGKVDCGDRSDEVNCTKKSCNHIEFQCNDDRRCIPLAWKCDGDIDCNDRSDEVNCTKKQCKDTEFQCDDSIVICLPFKWRCDGERDCNDGSDEHEDICKNKTCGNNSDEVNCTKKSCDENQFQCKKDGTCIPLSWRCDADKDCVDGSDESEETCQKCRKEEFQCTNKLCISKLRLCDGVNDCNDGSDEFNCPQIDVTNEPTVKCGIDEFQCTNKLCISENRLCDGVNDCNDGSDEVNCPDSDVTQEPTVKCRKEEFQCTNKLCVSQSRLCDGVYDCSDGSDEVNCPDSDVTKEPTVKCLKEEFQCTNKLCISENRLCDGVNDCNDGSDEVNCPDIDVTKEPTVTCGKEEFQCTNKLCISKFRLCDGFNDCNDGSDEVYCPQFYVPPLSTFPCSPDMFECYSGLCIPLWWVCDGAADCPRREDELYCHSKPSKCHDGEFHCEVDNSCIKIKNVCDKIPHCTNGTDEMNCDNYQEFQLDVDEQSSNMSSLIIYWIPPIHQGIEFEFLPSIRKIDDENLSWMNNTDWIEDTFFQFSDLEPNTRYNMTVYMRIKKNLAVFWQRKYVNAKTTGKDNREPQYLTAQQLNNTHVQLKWQLPKQMIGNKMEYTVSISQTISSEKLEQDDHFAYTLAGNFVPGETYTFKVSAKNEFENDGSNVALLKFEETGNGLNDKYQRKYKYGN